MKTDFLFATPSILVGLGRLVDLFGVTNVYNESVCSEEADARGMYSDFRITGEDIADAIQYVKAEDSAEQLNLFNPA